MLIKLNVENYKSFDNEAEISFVSSSKIRSNPSHKEKIKQTSILKYGVVYGANASGKSNLVDVFTFIKQSVQGGIPVTASNDFCRNKKENKEKPSTFEIQFTVGDTFYAYGFSVILSQRRITEEWLYELLQSGEANNLFEREEGKAPILGEGVSTSATEKNRFSVYAEDFAGQDAFLFLTEMNHNKKYGAHSKLRFFKDVFTWIVQNIIILDPNTAISNFEQYYDEKSLTEINKLIQTFDTGISNVSIKKISMEELSRMIPEQILQQIIADLKARMVAAQMPQIQMSWRTANSIVNIKLSGNNEPEISTLSLKHGTSIFDFDFKDESDGTRRIFDLIDMLLTKRDDIVYVVDELERSLHPKLTEHFLQLFMEAHEKQKVQLLFTTHEDSIMDLDIFRRDEIWFVERDTDNDSTIYSLDRFKVRYDTKLSKAYLEGRYGAIPVFKRFSFKQED